MKHSNLVGWSVLEANRRRRRRGKKDKCPHCGRDTLKITHDIRPEFKSQCNPGECLVFDCSACGYNEVSQC